MKCFRFDDDIVIAKDRKDAPVVWHEEFGEFGAFIDNWTEWEEVPDNKKISIHKTNNPKSQLNTKTAAEWAAKKGRGFLCTSQ